MTIDLRRYRALIFDMDGTLMDSMWVWHQIDIEYFQRFGIQPPPDLQKKIGGKTIRECAVYIKEITGIPDSYDTMISDWNKMAWEKYSDDVFPKKGAVRLLQMCRERGIRTGIASSNSNALVTQCLKRRGLEEYLDVILSGEHVKRGKPAPDIYLRAARRLKTEPWQCLVFEDIPDGIIAGHNAGMTTCAVYDPSSEKLDGEKRRLADYYIHDFTELTEQ